MDNPTRRGFFGLVAGASVAAANAESLAQPSAPIASAPVPLPAPPPPQVLRRTTVRITPSRREALKAAGIVDENGYVLEVQRFQRVLKQYAKHDLESMMVDGAEVGEVKEAQDANP